MADELECLMERWPGYNEQSWSQRFAELDRINQQRHEEYMALIKQIGDQMRKNAETLGQIPAAIADARRQALEQAAKVAEDLGGGRVERNPDGSLRTYDMNCKHDRGSATLNAMRVRAQTIAKAIRALATP